MSAPVRVGIIDGGVTREQAHRMSDARDFTPVENGTEALIDSGGHGARMVSIIAETAPEASLLLARAFTPTGLASPQVIADALDWLTHRVDLVSMSFGLPADRAVLHEACSRAIEAGLILVASAPAQGPRCYPAAYPGVVAATGDARCQWGQISSLPGGKFGTWCASPEQMPGARVSGASLAAAHLSGQIANLIAETGPLSRDILIERLNGQTVFVGRESRSAGEPAPGEPAER